jgi:hypothetical protein
LKGKNIKVCWSEKVQVNQNDVRPPGRKHQRAPNYAEIPQAQKASKDFSFEQAHTHQRAREQRRRSKLMIRTKIK